MTDYAVLLRQFPCHIGYTPEFVASAFHKSRGIAYAGADTQSTRASVLDAHVPSTRSSSRTSIRKLPQRRRRASWTSRVTNDQPRRGGARRTSSMNVSRWTGRRAAFGARTNERVSSSSPLNLAHRAAAPTSGVTHAKRLHRRVVALARTSLVTRIRTSRPTIGRLPKANPLAPRPKTSCVFECVETQVTRRAAMREAQL